MCAAYGLWIVTIFVALAPQRSVANDGPDKAAALLQCFDDHKCLTAERTSWDYLIHDLPSCQTAERVWWSSKPPVIPVTLITQLSVARLEQLKAQCATWRGPLAAAIFLPLVNPARELSEESSKKLLDATASIEGFFLASEANTTHGCQLRMVLMYELFEDAASASSLYPVNTLRNYARLMSDTDLITNIDVDLLPSLSISTAMADPAVIAQYTAGCRAGGVYVWPAFQTNCKGVEYTDSIALGGRDALQQALQDSLKDECVTMFEYKYPVFHGPTQYARWYVTQEPYDVQYNFFYEPWYLSWRWTTPLFDFRYRGYGYNKCVQAAAMNATGAIWRVSPHGFVIHRPHEQTSMRKSFVHVKTSQQTIKDTRNTMYGHMALLWETAQSDLARISRLDVRVEDSFRLCQRLLPWWRPPPQPATEPEAVAVLVAPSISNSSGGGSRRRG